MNGSVRAVRIVAAVIASAGMVAAGALAGEFWWFAAAAGVLAAIGTIFDHQLGMAQVLVVLALVIGLSAADVVWFLPVLIATTVASFELAAAADRTSSIRPTVTRRDIVPAVFASAVIAGVVLVIGEATRGGPTFSVLGAAVAAAFAVRVLAR